MAYSKQHRRNRGRNLALAGVLLFLVVLFFVVSLVKMSGSG